jgi:hypothetical protein
MKINNEQKIKEFIYMIPLLIITSVIPLIVRYSVQILDGEWFEFWTGTYLEYDFFSYGKAILIFVVSITALALFLLRIIFDKFRFNRNNVLIFVGIYCTFVLISAFNSRFDHLSIFGSVQRYEGVIILIAYMFIFFLAYEQISSNQSIKIVLRLILLSALIISIIGVFQYFGIDFLKSQFGKGLIYPIDYYDNVLDRSSGNSRAWIYSTFGNSNYVGSYMAMIFPISLGLYFFQSKQKSVVLYGFLSLVFYMMCKKTQIQTGE